MKKITAVLLSISLLLAAAGCMKEPPVSSTESTTASTQYVPNETEPTDTTLETQPQAVTDLPLLAFSAPITMQQHKANDGTVLFTYSYQNVSLILEDPQIADAIVIDFLNLVDYESTATKNILSDAESAYTGQSDWVPYSYSTLFSPERFDQGVLSLYGIQALYNGSPRSTTANLSVTYDLLSGRQLELKDILVTDYSADALSQLIANALGPLAEQGMLFSDYAYVVSELFTTNRPIDNWYLSDHGLCFYFAPYEIAPYSAGTIVSEIPYEALTGLLKDEYFPAEMIEYSGHVLVEPFLETELEQFSQFAELIIDENGTEYVIHTNGCLQNVRIDLGSRLDDGSFLAEATVFASSALCSSDAIMIQFSNDMTQKLQLTYEDSGEVISLDLTGVITDN